MKQTKHRTRPPTTHTEASLSTAVVEAGTNRPPRPAWISDALLTSTIELWSRAYGHPLGENDAIEILENVGRLAEALLDAKRRMRK
ncbi:MAG: hypothetical protein KA191_13065 [Verrucomicrobia bacterium]|nr:hypothetical protein [Verrucomicrobiota bacterium]HNS23146.1 hypothetical protein [Sedimentisphaerales bacterium]HOT82948.1 hypothetical protein [Candidatus Defluviicoccus seviourii]HNU31945.1 hypothetical protein [Sedimentisphaerales bacterium]HQF60112.1 hypothetical protein [Verrucomicrobiota bacterium]